MKEIAEEDLKENDREQILTDVVVTVPSYFNDTQRQATIDTGCSYKVIYKLNSYHKLINDYNYNCYTNPNITNKYLLDAQYFQRKEEYYENKNRKYNETIISNKRSI
ncbi:hypothetical protein PIROE2DRAFT_15599 [Piromyces sp. E2]|nr:hypothetical protein PIROE2DRAFT_15599 [Piromyces sp. E2]|eukprot:OUM59006.1 hypothetical protein PIROE2DRAFT_15599 [Piromyces sp. E2]